MTVRTNHCSECQEAGDLVFVTEFSNPCHSAKHRTSPIAMTYAMAGLATSDKILARIVWLRHFLGWLRSAFCARQDLILENSALRQQLLALHAQRPRPRLTTSQTLFWVVLRRLWARWKEPLILVTPGNGSRLASCRLSAVLEMAFKGRSRGGRKPVSKEIRALIFQMVAENPTWGAPRIHGELLMLGFDLWETTVSRFLPPPTPPPARRRISSRTSIETGGRP